MLMEISFQAPTPYDGDEGVRGPPSTTSWSDALSEARRAKRARVPTASASWPSTAPTNGSRTGSCRSIKQWRNHALREETF